MHAFDTYTTGSRAMALSHPIFLSAPVICITISLWAVERCRIVAGSPLYLDGCQPQGQMMLKVCLDLNMACQVDISCWLFNKVPQPVLILCVQLLHTRVHNEQCDCQVPKAIHLVAGWHCDGRWCWCINPWLLQSSHRKVSTLIRLAHSLY